MSKTPGSKRRWLPSLTSIRSFEAVGRHRSFTKAANELSVTQTAVSHQVKTLEEDLGLKLFIRTNAGVELTEHGQYLLPIASSSLDELADAAQRLRQRAVRIQKELVIRVTPFVSSFWLVPRIADFSRRHPDIELVLAHSQSPVGTGDTDFSFAISYSEDMPEGFTCDYLFSAPLTPLCTPSLIERAGGALTIEGLKDEVLIYETTYDWWAAWFELAGAPDLSNVRRVNIDDPNIAVQVGLSGQGVILAPPKLLRQHMEAGNLVAPFDLSLAVDIDYKLFSVARASTDAHLARFRKWIMEEVRASEGDVLNDVRL